MIIDERLVEYLTYVAAVGDSIDSKEMRYEDENIFELHWAFYRHIAKRISSIQVEENN